MDWNKSNSILIIAFIVLNIFLLLATFSNVFSDNSNTVIIGDFKENVESILKNKNINIKCEIPKDIYLLPVLETEYDMIEINNEFLQNYLGKGIEAQEDVFIYSNDKNQILEIVNNKKIVYTIRNKVSGEIKDEEYINKLINSFIIDKNLNNDGFYESNRFISNDGGCIRYTEKYNEYFMDNSYMCFYVDKDGIYKFEMQRVNSVMEIKDKIKTIPAIEALPRIITYDNIKNKDITDIKMTYYCTEDENWSYIERTNSDPTWKVIFNDGTELHLPSQD